ncbi:twin-arginine translocation signal domain-containing protein, partial [Mesorhizobium sp.]|uniref:twin-arginine translocation signal domain-containing protein n=1 Tax=Mesorhizobium sp. TaxID=1871066 RepID=UPI00257CEB85
MTTELEYLKSNLHMSRREFLSRASALGLGAVTAASLLANAAAAEAPVKGGHLKIGTGNGASTDTLDPAY